MTTNAGAKGETKRFSEETQAARKAWLDYKLASAVRQAFSDVRYNYSSDDRVFEIFSKLCDKALDATAHEAYSANYEQYLNSPGRKSDGVRSLENFAYCGAGISFRCGAPHILATADVLEKLENVSNYDELSEVFKAHLIKSWMTSYDELGLNFYGSLEEALHHKRNLLPRDLQSTDTLFKGSTYYHFPMIEWDASASRVMISYYNSEANFIRGVRTKTRAGRYMKMVCPDIPEQFLQYLVGGPWDQSFPPLKITDDPDEIERVYTDGPNSCMSYSADDYQSSMHPVRVYGNSPDLVVAYIQRADHVTARTIMRRDMKGFSTIYGDGNRLRQSMLNAGMSKDVVESGGKSVYGCHIQRVKDETYTHLNIVPYIDGYSLREVTLEGRAMYKLVRRNTGDHYGDTTNGLTGDPEDEGNYCEFYEDHFRDDTHEVLVGFNRWGQRTQVWSERAVENHATWSEHYEMYIHDALTTVETESGEMCTDDPDFADMVQCSVQDVYIHRDDASVFGDPDNDEYISDRLVRDKNPTYAVCAESDTVNHLDDMIDYHGKTVAKWWIEQNDPDFFTSNDNDDTSDQKEAA